MFRNIIWDVDGTLFDTYPAIARAFQAALHDFGKDASSDWIERLAKVSLSHCATTLAGQYHLNEEDIGQGFGKHYESTPPEAQPPFPGVIRVCEYIRNLGGINVIVTHRGHKGTNELLAASKMTRYFSGCLARDDGYPKKPDPAAFEAILKMHHLQREATLAVGDREIDILAGRRAGLFTCLFDPKADGGVADLTIDSYEELYRFLVADNVDSSRLSPSK